MKLRVDRITNQRGATATLLRTSWREGKRVRHKTVANLALMEPELVDGLEILLNGGIAFDPAKGAKGISILRALPHGHAAAALGTFRRNDARIAAEAALDGIYVVRSSLPADSIGPEGAVEACKALSGVERAFRCVKSDLRVRPIHVRTEEHVRGHVFLCMLAYHVEWHMRRRLAPILFEDHDREGTRAQRPSPVAKAEVSPGAKLKAATGRTRDGLPVHSFATLLDDLSTLTLNTVKLAGKRDIAFEASAKPTRVQKRALDLLGVDATVAGGVARSM